MPCHEAKIRWQPQDLGLLQETARLAGHVVNVHGGVTTIRVVGGYDIVVRGTNVEAPKRADERGRKTASAMAKLFEEYSFAAVKRVALKQGARVERKYLPDGKVQLQIRRRP